MKNGTLIAIVIGIVVVFVFGMYAQNTYDIFSISSGENGYSMSCNDALNNFYYGAQPTKCIAYSLNANRYTFKNSPNTLYKIMSVSEKTRNCGSPTPAKPTGCDTFCTVVVSHSFSDTLTCPTATSRFGDLNCVNGYCDYTTSIQIPDSCDSGDSICLSDTTYSKCLANGKYSGILSCPSGNICTDGTCESSSDTPRCANNQILCGDKTCQTNCYGHGVTPNNPIDDGSGGTGEEIPIIYWYIGGGILGLVLILSLIGKK